MKHFQNTGQKWLLTSKTNGDKEMSFKNQCFKAFRYKRVNDLRRLVVVLCAAPEKTTHLIKRFND